MIYSKKIKRLAKDKNRSRFGGVAGVVLDVNTYLPWTEQVLIRAVGEATTTGVMSNLRVAEHRVARPRQLGTFGEAIPMWGATSTAQISWEAESRAESVHIKQLQFLLQCFFKERHRYASSDVPDIPI